MKDRKSAIKLILGIGILILGFFIINRLNIFKGYGPNEIKEYISGKELIFPP